MERLTRTTRVPESDRRLLNTPYRHNTLLNSYLWNGHDVAKLYHNASPYRAYQRVCVDGQRTYHIASPCQRVCVNGQAVYQRMYHNASPCRVHQRVCVNGHAVYPGMYHNASPRRAYQRDGVNGQSVYQRTSCGVALPRHIRFEPVQDAYHPAYGCVRQC